MADPTSMTTAAAAGKLLASEHADVLREAVRLMLIEIMEAEVAQVAGGQRYERSAERSSYRNGYRERAWDTRVGSLELAIPRLRSGSYFPSFLEPRRRSRAGPGRRCGRGLRQRRQYAQGRAPRGPAGYRGHEPLHGEPPLPGARRAGQHLQGASARRSLPLPLADAKVERVESPVACATRPWWSPTASTRRGRREVIALDVGEAETEAFWREFLRGLLARGLNGVRLAISDAHEGLKKAIAQVLGCPWQRCTVHFARDMQGHVQRAQKQMVAAAIRQVFAADELAEARSRLASVVASIEAAAPKVALLLEAAEEELLAFMAFPREHWAKLRSTNPLERLNKEIARRSDVVGIYPNDAALVRLAGALLLEQNDEWLVGRRYLSAESLAGLYAAQQAYEPEQPAAAREVVLLTTG